MERKRYAENIAKSCGWFGIYIFASCIGTFIAMIFIALFGNIKLDVSNEEQLVENIAQMILDTMIHGLLIASIICIIIFLIYKKVRKYPFDITRLNVPHTVFSFSLGLFFNIAISIVLGLIYSLLPEDWTSSLEASTDLALNNDSFFIMLLTVGILVPIMEEIIFRYGIFKTLSRSNVIMAYVVSALVFGIMHGNVIQGCYTAILGIVLAYLYHKTNNIWYPIFVHMGLNSSSVIFTFLKASDWVIVSSILVAIGVIVVLFKNNDDIKQLCCFWKRPASIPEQEPLDKNDGA